VAAFIRRCAWREDMILVEHDMETVMGVSDHCGPGRRPPHRPGTPDAVRHNPLVVEAYLAA